MHSKPLISSVSDENTLARTTGSIIEAGFRLRGIKLMSIAKKLVAKARISASLNEKDAMQLALEETKLSRE